jgi:iron complex transport system substrate-binding protein
LTGHAPTPSEKILSWPVDVVVVCGDNLEDALAPFRTLPPFQYMSAVKEGRAVLLHSNLLSSVTHHRIDGYEELARALHPEAFR